MISHSSEALFINQARSLFLRISRSFRIIGQILGGPGFYGKLLP